MMDKILWNLFKTTGDCRYFIMLKELENLDGNKESKGNNH